MAAPTSSSGWVSSLTKSLEADAARRNAAFSAAPGGGAFGNPFASVGLGMNPAVTTSMGAKEDKNSMMAAFTDLGFDKSSTAVAAASSKALLAKKEIEKQQEEKALAEHRARREALRAAKQEATKSAPASALMQAIDAFAGEVSQSDAFASSLNRKSAGAGSRRARQKQEKAQERADAHEGRRAGKTVRDAKRHQRREQHRHVY